LMECNELQRLCVMLLFVNSVNLLAREGHETANEIPSAIKSETAVFPEGLKKDLAVMRKEMQEIKVEFSAKLNHLLLASCRQQNFETESCLTLPTDGRSAIWIPLPTTGDGFDSFVRERYTPRGDTPTHFEEDATQPCATVHSHTAHSGNALSTVDKIMHSRTNYTISEDLTFRNQPFLWREK